MPDPNVLYIVTTVVVLALVAWVVIVLSRPANRERQVAVERATPHPSGAGVEKDRGPIGPS